MLIDRIRLEFVRRIMKLPSAAMAIGSASLLAIIAGTVYILDCRSWAKSGDEITGCYLTGLPIMGIGAAGGGGFKAGYETYNPNLRQPTRRKNAAEEITEPES